MLQAINDTSFAEQGGFAFSVFVVFCVMNVLNFTMVAGHIAAEQVSLIADRLVSGRR